MPAYLKGLLHGSHTISHGSSGGFEGLVVAKDRTTAAALLGSQKKNRLGDRMRNKLYQQMCDINHGIFKLVQMFSQEHTEESAPRPGLSL